MPENELIDIATQCKVHYVRPDRLNDEKFVKQIKDLAPDIILIATFDKRIPKQLIEIPPLGTINIHTSLLPQYRGACPEFWVLRNGEKKTGITIHYVSEDFDAGDIIMQETLAIAPDETLGQLLYRLTQTAAKLVMTMIETLEKNETLPRKEQEHVRASNAPLVQAPDLEINWNMPKKEIYDLVRAGNPIGGAWTIFRGFQMKIWHTDVALDVKEDTNSQPGKVYVDIEKERVCIKAKDGYIELKVVQPALYYIVDGWSFAVKTQLKTGERLGERTG